MRISRRHLISHAAATGAALSLPWVGAAHAEGTEIEYLDFAFAPPVEWPAGQEIPTLDQYEHDLDQITGPENPFKSERMRAAELLKEMQSFAAEGKTPYQIAQHFHTWRKGEKIRGDSDKDTMDRKYFTREWPVRGNPVIMGFFIDSTGLKTPQGDATWWCAAFISDCIRRSLMGKGVKDRLWPYNEGAASAAYRSFGKAVDSPQQGDLVVFKNNQMAWSGHVGFVQAVDGNTIQVLGGNQGAQNEYNGGEVNISKFAKSSNRLTFHSFRRHDILH